MLKIAFLAPVSAFRSREQLAVARRHRLGRRRYWRRKSRRRRPGRPCVEAEFRDLIRRLATANPPWGAPRIHGELLKLGYDVAEATVDKYVFVVLSLDRRRIIPFTLHHRHRRRAA